MAEEGDDSKPTAAKIALRVLQLLTIAMAVTGTIWASSDWLLTHVLAGAPVTPLSVLLIIYGVIGTLVIEVLIRAMTRKAKGKKS